MMKKFFKVMLLIIGIFSMILSAACSDQGKAAVEKIEQSLKEKYGEEFKVEKIGDGYGTVTTNTLKALVSSKVDPNKNFDVEITKDLNKVWDKYMNVVMSEKMDPSATKMAESVFGQEVWVKSNLSSRGHSFPDANLNDPKMEVKEYLGSQSDVSVLLDIFIKSDGKVDVEKEAVKLELLADELIAFGTKNANISVYYIDESQFSKIESEYSAQGERVFKYFSEDGRSYYTTWMEIEDSNKQQSLAEITQNFSANRGQ
jgi:hypothetical protein